MDILTHPLYLEDIAGVTALDLPWEKLRGKSVVISGASGMIGSLLVDVLMEKNRREGLSCHIYAVGRNMKGAKERFASYWENDEFEFVSWDVSQPLSAEIIPAADFVLHLASNTHPVAYATEPIQTITTNILGTSHLLELANAQKAERFLLASSCEIYGENRGDVERFDESYCGYIDSNTLRAGYPESKRCSETLCQAYAKQENMDVVVARISRVYGPTLRITDTKALSQFISKALVGENIVLKSEGKQYYSYLHVRDAVSGILTILLKGDAGEAYNIADEASDIHLKDLAGVIASTAGKKVVFELPDAVEQAGFSTATKALLDGSKLKALGWRACYEIEEGLRQTMSVLKDIRK